MRLANKILIVAALTIGAHRAAAQVDVIRGQVLGPDGQPLAGAADRDPCRSTSPSLPDNARDGAVHSPIRSKATRRHTRRDNPRRQFWDVLRNGAPATLSTWCHLRP